MALQHHLLALLGAHQLVRDRDHRTNCQHRETIVSSRKLRVGSRSRFRRLETFSGGASFIKALTMYNEHDPLADRWRYAVGRDAKVRSHLQPGHFRDIEDRSFDAGHCDRRSATLLSRCRSP